MVFLTTYLECLPDPFEGGGPPLGRVVCVGEQELRQLSLTDPAGGVRLLLAELQPQDLTLQTKNHIFFKT